VEFLGRIDHQVKVRGFRIELGEIEAVLCAHAAVREAVVMAREDAPGDKRIVAYIVPREDLPGFREANQEGLRAHLRARLPEYMVPSAFVMLEALPLTPSGKVDRRALPVPERASSEREYIAPRTATEEKLAALCAELLRVERVGVEDDFFELGGHSLLATQFISRIRDEFAIELALRTLFEKSTLAALACEIERVRAEGVAINLPPIKFVARDAHRVKLSTLVKPGDGSATSEITTPVA
jgi:acyl carrier protein